MRDRFLAVGAAWVAGFLISLPWAHSPTIPAPHLRRDSATSPVSVIVNEVGWGGTAANPADEWVELYNTTGTTISLDGWHLSATDESPVLPLAGQVGPFSYYLIERTDDSTISDIVADLVCPFGRGLSNDGEALLLTDMEGVIVDTVNSIGGPWPNGIDGAAPDYRSMERISPWAADVDGSWASNDGSIVIGCDAAGNPLNGTPGAANAAYVPVLLNRAELVVQKAGPTSAIPGERLEYRIRLTNLGGVTASDVALTETLPGVLAFINESSDFTYTQSSGQVSWEIGDVSPQATASISLVAELRADTLRGAEVTNAVTVTTATPEVETGNNHALWVTSITSPSADLVVTKRGPANISVPGIITYQITVTNAGPNKALSAVLTDTLPDGVQFIWSTGSPAPSVSIPDLRWELGDLASATGVTFAIAISTTQAIAVGDTITNTAIATSKIWDAAPENNVADWATVVGQPRILISGALYDGYQIGDSDEAVEIVNAGTAVGELEGWNLCKDTGAELGCWPLPEVSIPPGDSIWLARNAQAFADTFGFSPDCVPESWPELTNTGDEILLRSSEGEYVDTLVYGEGTTAVPGWTGPQVRAYLNHMMGESGQILSRIRTEDGDLPAADTDTELDWMQSTADPHSGRRVRYPGWDTEILFQPLAATEAATVVVGIAPDNAFEVISATLQKARQTISVEVYSLRHPGLIDALVGKARDGVSVTVLLEGDPVGVGSLAMEWQTQLYACRELEAAGGQCWFMIHKTTDQRYQRYQYLHPKLIIVDSTWVVIGSQNLTPTGLPADDKFNGTYGSRGAVLATNAPAVVERAETIFGLDCDPVHHADLLRWNTGYIDKYGLPIEDLVDLEQTDGVSYTVAFSRPLVISGTFGLELFTAPEAALRRSDALLGLLGRAGQGDTVLAEQLYEHVAWGESPEEDPNLRLEAYFEAARRGARVRILVNSKSFVDGVDLPAEEGRLTTTYVNEIGRLEGLDLRAAVGNPTGEGIHNKMILVDLHDAEQVVHIGSINGSESASKVNREIAIQVSSAEAYDYLSRMFYADWWSANPVYLPVVARGYTAPPPPAHYIVISEVAYTGSAEEEWIELYNPTPAEVELGDYKIGDAESAESYEPMFRFPAGTVLAPGATLVIAVNGTQVPQADLEFYGTTTDVPDMVVYDAWGHDAYPLGLRNLGDQVVLLGREDIAVDAVVWGDASYLGVVPHPGVLVIGASLERCPPAIDTNDCTEDFRERYPPTPGEIPAGSSR